MNLEELKQIEAGWDLKFVAGIFAGPFWIGAEWEVFDDGRKLPVRRVLRYGIVGYVREGEEEPMSIEKLRQVISGL